jgi:hypothetical protein
MFKSTLKFKASVTESNYIHMHLGHKGIPSFGYFGTPITVHKWSCYCQITFWLANIRFKNPKK